MQNNTTVIDNTSLTVTTTTCGDASKKLISEADYKVGDPIAHMPIDLLKSYWCPICDAHCDEDDNGAEEYNGAENDIGDCNRNSIKCNN